MKDVVFKLVVFEMGKGDRQQGEGGALPGSEYASKGRTDGEIEPSHVLLMDHIHGTNYRILSHHDVQDNTSLTMYETQNFYECCVTLQVVRARPRMKQRCHLGPIHRRRKRKIIVQLLFVSLLFFLHRPRRSSSRVAILVLMSGTGIHYVNTASFSSFCFVCNASVSQKGDFKRAQCFSLTEGRPSCHDTDNSSDSVLSRRDVHWRMLARAPVYCLFFQDAFCSFRFDSSASGGQSAGVRIMTLPWYSQSFNICFVFLVMSRDQSTMVHIMILPCCLRSTVCSVLEFFFSIHCNHFCSFRFPFLLPPSDLPHEPRITGGNDKQGFSMKQGVLLPYRVRLLLADGHSPDG